MGGMLSLLVAALRGDAVGAAVPFYGYPTGEEPDWTDLRHGARTLLRA